MAFTQNWTSLPCPRDSPTVDISHCHLAHPDSHLLFIQQIIILSGFHHTLSIFSFHTCTWSNQLCYKLFERENQDLDLCEWSLQFYRYMYIIDRREHGLSYAFVLLYILFHSSRMPSLLQLLWYPSNRQILTFLWKDKWGCSCPPLDILSLQHTALVRLSWFSCLFCLGIDFHWQ